MPNKIIIHKGSNRRIVSKTTSTTTEDDTDYIEVEISNFKWFLANHAILWMSLTTLPFMGGAFYCMWKEVNNDIIWVPVLFGVSIFVTIISFSMSLSAYHEVFDNMV